MGVGGGGEGGSGGHYAAESYVTVHGQVTPPFTTIQVSHHEVFQSL